MKVLHVHPGRHFGGIQSMLVTLARERAACPSMEPSFAVCFDQARLAGELRAAGSPVFSLGPAQTRAPWQILRARARLGKLLAAERFDVVVGHSSWTHAVFGGVARRAGVPLVLWMHNNATAAGQNFIERLAGPPPDLVVCNSHFTAASLPLLFRAGMPPHRVIHCPVAAPVPGTPDPAQRAAVRAEADTPADATVVVQVGRLERWKGFHLHLEALAKLRASPGWVCWIVGGAQTDEQTRYLAELRALAAQHGIGERVRFLGQRQDVNRVLSAADLFCQPNGGEPFGIVFVEALYAGLPVVSVRDGGVREIADETCGRLIPPGDPAALAETLATLLGDRDLRARLAAAAPGRAASVSDPRKILNETHDAFISLGKQRGPTPG